MFLATLGAEDAQIEASFCEAIRIAKGRKSVSLEKARAHICRIQTLRAGDVTRPDGERYINIELSAVGPVACSQTKAHLALSFSSLSVALVTVASMSIA